MGSFRTLRRSICPSIPKTPTTRNDNTYSYTYYSYPYYITDFCILYLPQSEVLIRSHQILYPQASIALFLNNPIQSTKKLTGSMLMQRAYSELRPYQTKYPCIICTERVKTPITCTRCKSILCLSHVRRIADRCPYCRLEPFRFEREDFLGQLAQLDRKREEEWMIMTAEFECLVEGCGFRGKYHKMDLHRRKEHRDETLREVIFPQAREEGKRLRAVQELFKKLQQRAEQERRADQLLLILHNRSRGRVPIPHLQEMIAHADRCRHPHCQRVHVEEGICFIGTSRKEMTGCVEGQRFLMLYEGGMV